LVLTTISPKNTTSKFFQLFGVIAQCVRMKFCYCGCIFRCLKGGELSLFFYLLLLFFMHYHCCHLVCLVGGYCHYFRRGTCFSLHTRFRIVYFALK